jgi:hypothetical protein
MCLALLGRYQGASTRKEKCIKMQHSVYQQTTQGVFSLNTVYFRGFNLCEVIKKYMVICNTVRYGNLLFDRRAHNTAIRSFVRNYRVLEISMILNTRSILEIRSLLRSI